MRTKFVAGNWKMFNGPKETAEFIKNFAAAISDNGKVKDAIEKKEAETAIFPPSISICVAVGAKKESPIIIGAQNVHWEDSGAFTGEVSLPMVKECGCTHVIVGHSERRHVFGETDQELNKKVKAVFAHGLTPVFCVGETIDDRKAGETFNLLKQQLTDGLKDLGAAQVGKLIIAYEPVWAIGTGLTASADDAQDACEFIRKLVKEKHGESVAENVRILYGGSVKPVNTKGIISEPDIDGVLVGGASLKVNSFMAILEAII
jgi:triosephosphate isomerase